MIALLSLALASAAVAEPVMWLSEDRVLVTAVIAEPDSPMSHAKALVELTDLARRACNPIGSAMSEGSISLDGATDENGGEVLTVSEVYRCKPK